MIAYSVGQKELFVNLSNSRKENGRLGLPSSFLTINRTAYAELRFKEVHKLQRDYKTLRYVVRTTVLPCHTGQVPHEGPPNPVRPLAGGIKWPRNEKAMQT